MMLSQSKVDNRLLNLYKLRKADKTGKYIELDDVRAEALYEHRLKNNKLNVHQ